MHALDRVRDDFDRIARLTPDDAAHPVLYGDVLLAEIPPSCRTALEVGCGAGAMCRAMAARGLEVTGVDLSPEMIRAARSRTPDALGVDYRCGDVFEMELDERGYDCVLSAATLHHLPLEPAVARMAALVRPGGVLVIHDVRDDAGLVERLLWPAAVAARVWSRVRASGRLREPAELRAAWREHGRGEHYETMHEVEAWSRRLLPGSRVSRHLQWRYTVVWKRSSDV